MTDNRHVGVEIHAQKAPPRCNGPMGMQSPAHGPTAASKCSPLMPGCTVQEKDPKGETPEPTQKEPPTRAEAVRAAPAGSRAESRSDNPWAPRRQRRVILTGRTHGSPRSRSNLAIIWSVIGRKCGSSRSRKISLDTATEGRACPLCSQRVRAHAADRRHGAAAILNVHFSRRLQTRTQASLH